MTFNNNNSQSTLHIWHLHLTLNNRHLTFGFDIWHLAFESRHWSFHIRHWWLIIWHLRFDICYLTFIIQHRTSSMMDRTFRSKNSGSLGSHESYGDPVNHNGCHLNPYNMARDQVCGTMYTKSQQDVFFGRTLYHEYPGVVLSCAGGGR